MPVIVVRRQADPAELEAAAAGVHEARHVVTAALSVNYAAGCVTNDRT